MKTHTVGMDKVADYVLGKEDGIPRLRPGLQQMWSSGMDHQSPGQRVCLSNYLHRSLLRRWHIRGPYSHEPARLEVIILGMQGLGKPGVHQSLIARDRCPAVPGDKSYPDDAIPG